MSELFVRRHRPSREQVNRVLQLLHPDARLERVSRLKGGLSNHMYCVRYHTGTQGIGRIVLRMTTDWRRSPGENAQREHTTLLRLKEANIPAPRPLLLDVTGEFLGKPGIVISYNGRAYVNPARRQPWLRGLAEALSSVHRVTPHSVDLTHLDEAGPPEIHRRIQMELPEGLRTDRLAQEIRAALLEARGQIDWASPCLVHDDYWPGNVVWQNRQEITIVDWTMAKIGNPLEDVSQCRLDLAMTHGLDAAEAFLAEYEAVGQRGLGDVWFFDLLRGLSALASFRSWLPGYIDSGLTYMTEDLAETRLRAFLNATLKRRREATLVSR